MIVKQFEIQPEKYRIVKESDSCKGLLLVLQRYAGRFWFFGWHDYWYDVWHQDFDRENCLNFLIEKAEGDFKKIQDIKKRNILFKQLPEEIESFTLPRNNKENK